MENDAAVDGWHHGVLFRGLRQRCCGCVVGSRPSIGRRSLRVAAGNAFELPADARAGAVPLQHPSIRDKSCGCAGGVCVHGKMESSIRRCLCENLIKS